MGEFRMPSLGADMDAGTIIEWRVKPGDTVHRGDIVAVVDTEKSDIDIEVFEDGVIEDLVVDVGVEVPVGTVLAHLRGLDEAEVPPADAKRPHRRRRAAATKSKVAPPPPSEAAAEVRTVPAHAKTVDRTFEREPELGTEPFVRASPRARRQAAALGIDLQHVAGSGPSGAVSMTDLDAASAAPAPPPTPAAAQKAARGKVDRQAATRRAIGELMARSKREIPHYYLSATVDMSAALRWLADANATRPVTERMLPAALLLKATALAARDVQAMNGFWDGEFRPSTSVHLGVAIARRGGGLVAPAIHDADRLAVDGVMDALRDLVERVRSGTLRASEMSDPTLTVTNLGDQGVDEVFGVIYPPQVALVGVGKIAERPWAEGGMVGARPVTRITLAADHRVSDGHDGARFLATIDRLLQTPEDL